MKFNLEAFKHGKTQEDIEFLYASPSTQRFDNGISDRGNERIMLVGFDQNANLMEASLELIFDEDNDGTEYFYHAMKATPEWQKLYEKKRRHG